MGEAYVDQEVSLWSEDGLRSGVVFWIDFAHVPDHAPLPIPLCSYRTFTLSFPSGRRSSRLRISVVTRFDVPHVHHHLHLPVPLRDGPCQDTRGSIGFQEAATDAGLEGFERHESRCNKPQLVPVVLHV